MRRLRRSSVLAAAAFLPAWHGTVWAQGVEGSAAQALFEQGRTMMEAGRHAEACGKFAESQKLEPATGTLLNLAVCHEHEGKTATAYLEYHEALSRAVEEGNIERQAICRDRLNALEPRLSRLVLRQPHDRPAGFWVTLDGVALGPAILSVGVPVDLGAHVVVCGAPGKEQASLSASVEAAGTNVEVALPDLKDAPRPPPQVTPPPEPQGAPVPIRPIPAAPVREPAGGAMTLRILTGVSLGLGVTGIAVGSYSGLQASIAWDDRNAHCAGACDTWAVAAGERAQAFASASNVSFGIGLVGLAVGGYLLVRELTSDTPREPIRASVDSPVGVPGTWGATW